MATVRHATADDVNAIMALSREFIMFAPHASIADVSAEELEQQIRLCIDNALVLVAEHEGQVIGMLFGILTGLWFAPSTLMAAELAWWVTPTARNGTAGIRLLTAFQDWAREKGAKVVTMSSLDLDFDTRVSSVLERMGFKASEHTYIKRVA